MPEFAQQRELFGSCTRFPFHPGAAKLRRAVGTLGEAKIRRIFQKAAFYGKIAATSRKDRCKKGLRIVPSAPVSVIRRGASLSSRGVRDSRLRDGVRRRRRIGDPAGQIGCDDLLDRPVAAADDGDTVALEDVFRPVAHVAGKHHVDAHGVQAGGDVGFTAAAFGGG